MESFIMVVPGITHADSNVLRGALIQAGTSPKQIEESIEKFLQGKTHTVLNYGFWQVVEHIGR